MGIGERLVGDGEVDDDVGVVEHVVELRPQRRVGAAGELEPLGGGDGVADGRPHPPGGARDRYSDRCGHQPAKAGLIGATALRKQPSSAPMQAAEMFSGA